MAPTAAHSEPVDLETFALRPGETHKTAIPDQPPTNRLSHRNPITEILHPLIYQGHTSHFQIDRKPIHRLPSRLCSQSRSTALRLVNPLEAVSTR